MKLWSMIAKHEGDTFVSTHLTHEGALRSAIRECFDFFCLSDGDTRFMVEAQQEVTVNYAEIAKMGGEELSALFTVLVEETWDPNCDFLIDIAPSTLEA